MNRHRNESQQDHYIITIQELKKRLYVLIFFPPSLASCFGNLLLRIAGIQVFQKTILNTYPELMFLSGSFIHSTLSKLALIFKKIQMIRSCSYKGIS